MKIEISTKFEIGQSVLFLTAPCSICKVEIQNIFYDCEKGEISYKIKDYSNAIKEHRLFASSEDIMEALKSRLGI